MHLANCIINFCGLLFSNRWQPSNFFIWNHQSITKNNHKNLICSLYFVCFFNGSPLSHSLSLMILNIIHLRPFGKPMIWQSTFYLNCTLQRYCNSRAQPKSSQFCNSLNFLSLLHIPLKAIITFSPLSLRFIPVIFSI